MTQDTPPEVSTRDALIQAGMALLAEGGPEALTLRRAAARAGVSHAAPAHHFKGLRGLQTAIAIRAFADFNRAMITHRDAAADTPFDRLAGICDGYLAFVDGQEGLFHLMFTAAEVDRDDPDFRAGATRAYGLLRAGCAPFTGGADLVFEGAVWSAVHGYATLGFTRKRGQAGGENPPPFRALLRLIVPDRPDHLGPVSAK